jgi:tetratricopeptide (TPR) repeat protein
VANLILTRLEGEPRRMAEEMVAAHPDSPWSWFALAHAIAWDYPPRNRDEAMGAVEKAVAGLPGNPDPLILQAELLLRYADRETALAFLDGLEEPVRSSQDLLVVKLRHLAPPSRARTEADLESMIEIYEGVLAENPDHVMANLGLGSLLMGIEGERERARTFVEHAAAVSPGHMPHFRLWQYIVEDPDLDAEGRASRVTEDVHHVLEDFPESPGRWAEMATTLGFFGFLDLQEELEGRVLREHPESWAAEAVLGTRMSMFAYEFHSERPASQEEYLEESRRLEGMIGELLDRPQHRDPSFPMEAYWNLFLLEKEKPDVDFARLSQLAESWIGYLPQVRDVWADQKCLFGALSLARHAQTLSAAKSLLAAGEGEMEKFANDLELQRPGLTERSIGVQEDHVRASQAYLSIASALVLAQEESFEEAETTLSQARDHDPEDDDAWTIFPLADLAAGTVKELRAEFARKNGDEAAAQKLLTSAEEFYLHGLRGGYYPRPDYGVGWTNPNETALQDLFEKRQGGLEGFEVYLASAVEGGLEARRAEVLATRIEDPQPIVPFALKNLEGKEVTSESYLGKVVVINFWGTW